MANRQKPKVLSDKSDDRPLRYRLRTRAQLDVFSGFSTAFPQNRQQTFGTPKCATSRLRLNIDKEKYYWTFVENSTNRYYSTPYRNGKYASVRTGRAPHTTADNPNLYVHTEVKHNSLRNKLKIQTYFKHNGIYKYVIDNNYLFFCRCDIYMHLCQ